MPPQAGNFDDYADVSLLIIFKDEKAPVTFQCCSRALARSSPVFDTMLYENSEGTDQKPRRGDWRLNLPDGDPTTFAMFMNIIHGYFQRVPRVITVQSLYRLTVLSHDYEASQVLAPWIDPWITSIEKLPVSNKMAHFRMLWICWELRYARGFIQSAQHILMQSQKTELANILQASDLRKPPDIVGM